MHHRKAQHQIPVGGQVFCGSRKMRIDAIDDSNVLDVTLTTLRGETVETRDPRQRDLPWILDDPGEGDMIEVNHVVKLGNKIRVGNHRQFRVVSHENGTLHVVIVGPEDEVV